MWFTKSFSPVFCSRNFIVLGFPYKCDPFWVNVCRRFEVWARFYFFRYRFSCVLAPFIEKGYPFSIELTLHLCQILIDHICVSLFLDFLLFCFIDLSVCPFCMNTLSSLRYCKSYSPLIWVFQLFKKSKLFVLFSFIGLSMQILELAC